MPWERLAGSEWIRSGRVRRLGGRVRFRVVGLKVVNRSRCSGSLRFGPHVRKSGHGAPDARRIRKSVDRICSAQHTSWIAFEVEYTKTFEIWWEFLTESEQVSVASAVLVLQQRGPALGRPQVDTLKGAKFTNLKELRIQHSGLPLRILFAFDPRRVAILLVGGNKQGDANWYERNIAVAERLYSLHLEQLRE